MDTPILSDSISQLINVLQTYSIVDPHELESGRTNLVLPKIPPLILKQMCQHVEAIFKAEASCLEISGSLMIVGDLHGHLLDLIRIIGRFGLPPHVRYLFLGDIVDRGEFSLETASILFSMKLCWPNNIYIIRGNHEFSEVCATNGFLQDIMIAYNSSDIFNSFVSAFSYMPLAAIVNQKTLCIHGGLGPALNGLDQLKLLERPIVDFSNPIIEAITWSDPTDEAPDYLPSLRGAGFRFGSEVFNIFITENQLERIIRGHECASYGIEEMFDSKLITVFSASNYCGISANQAGALCIEEVGGAFSLRKYPFFPLKYLFRRDALIVPFRSNGDMPIMPIISAVSTGNLDSFERKRVAAAEQSVNMAAVSLLDLSEVQMRKRANSNTTPRSAGRKQVFVRQANLRVRQLPRLCK